MGSKGRVPPAHSRRPLPSAGMMHPDPFRPPIRPPPGGFPPYDVLPPPEVMEQKLAAQHMEMQKLATENQKLAATHGTLRQELVAAQHELQLLHAHIGAMKSEREQQTRSLIDKIGRMETDLRAAESIKLELQQARAEAQSLVNARQELILNVQKLNCDLETTSSELQQMPRLLSELEALRQEYQHCRATYDYEKKLYNDHLEHLQAMEKNYMTMAREVEKLREKLANNTNFNRRTGGTYGAAAGFTENNATASYPAGQKGFPDGYANAQGGSPLPGGISGSGVAPNSGAGGTPQVGAHSGTISARAAYDAPKGPGHDAKIGTGPAYDIQRVSSAPGYDVQRVAGVPGQEAQRGPAYNAQRGSSFGPGYNVQMPHGYHDMHRAPGYDSQRTPAYDVHRAPVYDSQRALGYDAQKGTSYNTTKGPMYDTSSRGPAGLQGQVPPANNAPYESATPPARAGTGYEVPTRGGNTVHR